MKRYRVFDSHCDTATELWERREQLTGNTCHVSLDQTEGLDSYAQFFAFCTLGGLDTGWSCEQLLWEPLAYFNRQLEQHGNRISRCTNGVELDAARAAGRCAAFLSLEGAEGISCDPGRLEELRQAGITMVNLTWNADNALAGCSKTDGPGLSVQGREFVRRAQRLGILLDVSHVSDRAFWDMLDIAEAPIVASHSNSRTLCGHSRNLTDEQFRAICDCGGYAGINLYPCFLAEDAHADFETIYTHMDHFLQIGGEHVALGGDLDGISALPNGFTGLRDYPALASFLEKKGFSGTVIQNIYCDTMEKVVRKCTM